MNRLLLALGIVAAVAATTAAAGGSQFPQRIELPDGFQPEGIAAAGAQFYVGSIPTGAVYRGNLRTGAGRGPVTRGVPCSASPHATRALAPSSAASPPDAASSSLAARPT